MASNKIKTVFVCSSCGYESPKWNGRCPDCGEWNTLEEEVKNPVSAAAKRGAYTGQSLLEAIPLNRISEATEHRYLTGMPELDRVLGDGIVKGSLVLLGGDPGIGKSTLLLQICQYLGENLNVLYVSGEESPHQIKLRAQRLSVETPNLSLLAETDIQLINEFIKSAQPQLVIIDSIQTMNFTEIASSPGTISQVRECTNMLLRTAKALDIPVIIVGHVNKDGNIAGPKVLEHVVDAVLYFEGERNLPYRILRAAKNRFGSTNEIGVFEMLDDGLHQVENPSMMLLSGRPRNTSGTCVACVMEGSRPILAEVQGLVTPTGFGTPRRMATGFDYNRLALLIAVLEKRAGYFFSNMDTYINIVGGLKLDEPAADLTVALALISSLKDVSFPENVIAFGEIGLAGEVRAVNNCEQRINEASRMGFHKCIIPKHNLKTVSDNVRSKIEVIGVRNIREAFAVLVE